jgi:CRISPR-associated protein Csb1
LTNCRRAPCCDCGCVAAARTILMRQQLLLRLSGLHTSFDLGAVMPVLDSLDLVRVYLDDGAAIRCRSRLSPVGGSGDKVAPATYEGGRYAFESRRIDGESRLCVLLDSVASQANRIEEGLLALQSRRELQLPQVLVDFGAVGHPEIPSVSSLTAPHRIFDAIIRDSLLDGVPFPETEIGGRLEASSAADATALFEWCPTALLLGAWHSTGRRGGGGAKFPRAVVSEVIGVDVAAGVGTRSRIDPLGIAANVDVYVSDDSLGWTVRPGVSVSDRGKPRLVPGRSGADKAGRPSVLNHSSVTPSIEEVRGGVTIDHALQVSVLSFATLRRLHFPVKGERSADRDDAGRLVLGLLGIICLCIARRSTQTLRSRCSLVADGPSECEYIAGDGGHPVPIGVDLATMFDMFRDAVLAARNVGLPWPDSDLTLSPSQALVDLVLESRRRWAETGRFASGESDA